LALRLCNVTPHNSDINSRYSQLGRALNLGSHEKGARARAPSFPTPNKNVCTEKKKTQPQEADSCVYDLPHLDIPGNIFWRTLQVNFETSKYEHSSPTNLFRQNSRFRRRIDLRRRFTAVSKKGTNFNTPSPPPPPARVPPRGFNGHWHAAKAACIGPAGNKEQTQIASGI
jgi:hypothetical protein